MEFLVKRYRSSAICAIHHRLIVVGVNVLGFAIPLYLKPRHRL